MTSISQEFFLPKNTQWAKYKLLCYSSRWSCSWAHIAIRVLALREERLLKPREGKQVAFWWCLSSFSNHFTVFFLSEIHVPSIISSDPNFSFDGIWAKVGLFHFFQSCLLMLKSVSGIMFKWKKLQLKITWRRSLGFSFCGACPKNITMRPRDFLSLKTAKVLMPFLPNGKTVISMSQAQEELFSHVLHPCVLTSTFFPKIFSSFWNVDYGKSVFRKSWIPGFGTTEPLLGTIQPLKRFWPRLQSLKNKGKEKRERENSFDNS